MPRYNVRVKVVEHRYFEVEAPSEAEAGERAVELDCQGTEPYTDCIDSRTADLVVRSTTKD